MLSQFLRPSLIVALGVAASLPALAQEPEQFHPLWENVTSGEGQPFQVYPVIGENNPAPTAPPDNPAPAGMSLRSVPTAITEEITQLAAALGNDPVRIFNHVRNTIDYDHYYGLRKGPELTLLEGSGNDLDTCSLLAELLKAAGHTEYEFCLQVREAPIVGNDGKNLSDWIGLAEDPYPGQTFAQVFGGANPYPVTDVEAKRLQHAVRFCKSRNTAFVAPWLDYTSIGLTRFWLKLTYQGATYQLDPSFKRYETITGINLKSYAGYQLTSQDRAALLTTAGGTTGSGYVAGLNNANIASFLSARTGNLLANLIALNPGATVDEIVRGRRIIKENITNLTQAFPLPNVATSGYGGLSTWSSIAAIPAGYKSTINFNTGGLNYPMPTADLKGRKVALAASGNEVQLWLDDQKVAFTTVTAATYSFSMTVTHPGVGSKFETKTYKKNNQYVYALIYAFNASGRLVQKRYEELDKHLLTDSAGTGREARSELLNIMGLTWMYQTELANKLLAAQNGISHLATHRFGRMAQEEGFYVDVGLQFSADLPRDGIYDDRSDNVFHLGSLFSSAMEHGIIEQLQPGNSAISTVNVIRHANQVGDKRVYLINQALVTSGSAWTTVKTALAAYNNVNTKNGRYDQDMEPYTDAPPTNGKWDPGESYIDSTDLGQFEFMALNGGSVMLPKDRTVTKTGWQWSGSGWIIRTATSAGMVISGGYSGGYNTNYGNVTPAPVTNFGSYNPSYSSSPPSYSGSYFTPPSYSSPSFFGSDPVDMATGAFTIGNDDMASGVEGAPRCLAFSRYYTSNSRDQDKQRIGYGWTHSLNIRAVERTASEEALGLSSPRQAAAFLTAMTIASDLYRRDGTAKEWATAALTVGWYLDELTNNAVTIEIGHQQIQFIQKPDGSFEPPAGSTMTLQKVGTSPNHTYRLTQRNSNTFVFEKAAGVTDGSEQRIKQIIDQDGRTMTFEYLGGTPANKLNYVQDAAARRYTFRYDANHRIDRVTDSSDARFIGFAYDTSGNLVTYTDAEGKNSYYDYAIPAGQTPPDPSGTVAADHRIVRQRTHDSNVTTGQGVITQNVYDSLGRVSEQYLHGKTAKTYKLRYTGFANTEENPAGGITTYFYDDRGRATGSRDPDGHEQKWIYDGQDHIVEKTTGSGETTIYHYDGKQNVTQIDHPRGGGSTHMVYDSLGRLDLITDPDSNQTDYIYNPGNTKDRPDQVIDPAGTTTYQYITNGPAIGRIWKSTDQDNLVTEFAYENAANANGHPDWVKAPGGFKTDYTYSSRGDLLDITDPNLVKTVHTYNKRRQVTKTIVDQGGSTEATSDFAYDDQGNPESTTVPADNNSQRFKTRQEYSPTNKVLFTRTSDEDGEGANDPYTEVVYDNRDWQKEIYDPLRRLTSLTPHPNGNLFETTQPLARTSSKLYDGDGRPLSTTFPGSTSNRTSSIVYETATDGFPQMKVTSSDNLAIYEKQSRAGRTRYYTNRKSNVWEFCYDGLGRKTKIITPLDAAAGRSFTTEYLHRGAVKKVTEPSGQVTDFSYTPVTGRLAMVTDPTGTISQTLYDDNGNSLNTSETRTGVSGTKTTGRTYDRQNRLLSRTDENGQTIGYRYYASGKLWKIIYPGGSEFGIGHVEYTWWKSGQLKNVLDRLDSLTARTTTYEWNADGRLKKVTRPNQTVRLIKYDGAGRPDVIEEYGPGMKLIFVTKQGYYPSDEVAWRYQLPSKRTSGNDPPAMLAMKYNADNQLDTWDGQPITHDADGNMTYGPAPTGNSRVNYTYDSRNRLINALGANYTYDADGQRIGQLAAGVTSSYVVDLSSGLSKVLVRTKNGVPTRYVWGLGLLYEVTGSGTSAKTVSYHHDATGSTLALTDDSARCIERIGYTPWGQINHRVNITGMPYDTPFLFTGFFGNQTDANGLLHMRARYYHPRLGRFLNADPAQEGMNWYGYAAGNPTSFVDPMGLGIDGVLNAVQNTLSFLGMVPVYGALFDIVNTAISIGRGNYVDASINFASALPGLGDFVGGAKIAAGGTYAATAIFGSARIVDNFTPAVRAYDVGSFGGLKGASTAFDGLDIHHVAQSHPLQQIVSGYNRNSAPAIALPRAEHMAIPTLRGDYGGTARQLLAQDIINLRNYTNSPNSSLQSLIDLNKKMFPSAFTKP